ncbi:hypothetical protein F383_32330 [Gossypium arboreum]|uniref:Uncharacterized protein n=1 Tax=Gossypium arboreum TaxID=29729 RepID=A0A0B0P071_GOSAR|nr:hypothetical protein F383_25970 [Gossypium arboreum]KHG25589.1 hypothetical protein F383_32330 [Gossypium arboreum]
MLLCQAGSYLHT